MILDLSFQGKIGGQQNWLRRTAGLEVPLERTKHIATRTDPRDRIRAMTNQYLMASPQQNLTPQATRKSGIRIAKSIGEFAIETLK